MKARVRAAVAVLIAVAAAMLMLAGCNAHACDSHGGLRTIMQGIMYCNDGTKVGP